MYSTCLYCTKDLGANEVLETLPIGRRVAFDAKQGRLWVVCRGCEKWNLVPFDTRLETIDACERLFSETRVRFSTDNIGIARLKEGLELVRIGPAQRPEFAAWRYGDQFGRRRRVNILKGAAVAAGMGVLLVTRHAMLPVLGVSGTFGIQLFNWGNIIYHHRHAAVQVPGDNGTTAVMTLGQVAKARIDTRDGQDWSLALPVYPSSRAGFVSGVRTDRLELRGDAAVAALGRILPRVNASGGSSVRVRDAVHVLDERSSVLQVLKARPAGTSWLQERSARLGFVMAARLAANRAPPKVEPPVQEEWLHSSYALRELHPTVRLALEMLAHEDAERVALAGELKLLERQWRDAEEVAKIADSLAVTDEVQREVDRRPSS